MDDNLKTYLDAKFFEVHSEFGKVRSEFQEVHSEIGKVRSEIEASETRLLTEFWKWGRASDLRIRRVESSDATTVERLGAMEERIFTLERKVLGGKE